MLLERSELLARDGQEAGFATAMADHGLPLLASVPGVRTAKLGRGVENPGKFMLLVEWESLDAHARYSDSPAAGEFRALVGPYLQGGAMEHFAFG